MSRSATLGEPTARSPLGIPGRSSQPRVASIVDALLWQRPRDGALYEVRARPTAAGTATFFVNLHTLLQTGHQLRFGGRPPLSFEIARQGGALRYQLWIPAAERGLVERLLRASYEELELRPAAATTLVAPCVAVANMRLALGRHLPIRTAHHGEPLASLLSVLSGMSSEQESLVQLVVRPAAFSWKSRALREANALRGREGVTARSASNRFREYVRVDRERAKAITERARGAGYECTLRIAVGAASPAAARELLRGVASTFGGYSSINALVLTRTRLGRSLRSATERRAFPRVGAMLLTSEEIASLWHIPTAEPAALQSAHPMHVPPPHNATRGDRILGLATWPGDDREIGLSLADSRLHLHLLGPTGSGKTTAMLNLALQDIAAGRGVGVLDPKGDLVRALLERIPAARRDDVVYISPDQDDASVGINPLELGPGADLDLVAENTLTIFKRIYQRYWGMRTDDILKIALRTLLARGDATLAHVPLLLTDATFRAEVTERIEDPFVAGFWLWFNGLNDSRRTEAVGPVLNKLRDFLVRPRLRRLLCQPRSTVRMEEVVDGGKIFLADLSVGRWGESASELVGSFLVARLWQSVLARSARPESERRDFFLYVDEFQKFQGFSMPFADALAQARSLRLSLTLANQDLGQLSRELRDAVVANARSKVVFQCGQDDAAYLARTFAPLDAAALASLPRFEMAARLAIDGTTSQAFTLRTSAPSAVVDPEQASRTKTAALARYWRPSEFVDRELLSTIRWMGDRGGPSGWDA
jgi:Helicase HerA, central domain